MIDLRKYITKRTNIDEHYYSLLETVYKTAPASLGFLDETPDEAESFIKGMAKTLGTQVFAHYDLMDLFEEEIASSQNSDYMSAMDPLLYGVFQTLFGNDWRCELYSASSSEILFGVFGLWESWTYEPWQWEAMEPLRDWFILEFDADPENPTEDIIANFGPPDECDSTGSYVIFHFGSTCDPLLVDNLMEFLGAQGNGTGENWGLMTLGDYEGYYSIEIDGNITDFLDDVKSIEPKITEVSAKAEKAMRWFSANEDTCSRNYQLIDAVMTARRSERQILL